MYREFGKRTVDVAVGSLLALVVLPVLVVLAVVSAVVFRAWSIFVQPRVGHDGRTFAFPKVRSMPASSPDARTPIPRGKSP
jgi:lipopolysaccharide/colanic/teichoic acid biosynthesis glycosyltransferase